MPTQAEIGQAKHAQQRSSTSNGSELDDSHAASAPHIKPKHWPWAGRLRRYIYIDFAIYAVLLIIFCVVTLTGITGNSFAAYHFVQSVQQALTQEVRLLLNLGTAFAVFCTRVWSRLVSLPLVKQQEGLSAVSRSLCGI